LIATHIVEMAALVDERQLLALIESKLGSTIPEHDTSPYDGGFVNV